MRYRVAHRSAAARPGLTQVLGSMNQDQRQNVDSNIHAIGESVFNAWRYFNLLKGLQAGAKSDPENLLTHAIAIDVMYRAVFDALYAVVGTISDRRTGTLSIPNLINKSRRYSKDPELKRALTLAESMLNDPQQAPLKKLSNWRHEHVAHRTEGGRIPGFYENNKLRLDEVEDSIALLDQIANDLAEALTATRYDWRSATESVASSCESLLSAHAA